MPSDEHCSNLVRIQFKEPFLDFISNSSEFREYKLFCSFHLGWVIKPNMQAMLHFAQESRTTLISSSANRYHIVPRLSKIPIHALRHLMGNVYPHLLHHFHRQGVHTFRWFRASRMNLQSLIKSLHPTMPHLASATVACTQNQYFHHYVRIKN